MKNRLVFTLGLALLFLFPKTNYADSPITSTPFFEAYMDVEIVQKAKAEGIINPKIVEYLSSPSNPVDIKAAVINALSWGKNNAELFVSHLAYLKMGKPLSSLDSEQVNQFSDSLSADEIFSTGYLQAMDNYTHPENAITMLEQAKEKKSESFTVNIVLAIVKAQKAMDSDWTQVWKLTEQVLQDKTLKQDLRLEAKKIIVDYMSLYRDAGEVSKEKTDIGSAEEIKEGITPLNLYENEILAYSSGGWIYIIRGPENIPLKLTYGTLPKLSLDGKKILCSRDTDNDDKEETIYVMELDGLWVVATLQGVYADFSPDSKKVVYVSKDYSMYLKLFDLETKEEELLIRTGIGDIRDILGSVTWNGDYLLFSALGMNDVYETIRILNVKTGEILSTKRQGLWSSLSINRNKILSRDFSPKYPFRPTIFICDFDGKNRKRIIPEDLLGDHPIWSPDGTRITFAARKMKIDNNKKDYTFIENWKIMFIDSFTDRNLGYIDVPEGKIKGISWISRK